MNKFYSGNNKQLLSRIHHLNGVEKEVADFTDRDVIMEFVLEKKDLGDFHLRADTLDEHCLTLVCRLCGNTRFTVGQSPYFTGLRCDTCGYEVGVHEG